MVEYPFKDSLPIDEVLEREGYYKDWTHLDPEVFYSLTQISEYIKTKGYGVDVRLLISQLAEHFGLRVTQITDAMNEFNDLKPKAELSVSQSAEALTKSQSALNVANSADTLSKSVQEQFNQVVIDGDSSVEAAQARVDASGQTNATLKDRLDKEHNEVTTQLAEATNKIPQLIYMTDYGIKTMDDDPNYDCLPILIQAINEANSQNGYVKIVFPVGRFKFSSATNVPELTGFHIWFSGQGEEITKLYFTSGTYFTFGTDTGLKEGGGLENMSIVYDVPDPLSPTILGKAISGVNYRNLKLYNVCTFLQCGTSTIKSYSHRFTQVKAAVANQGKPLIKLVNGAGFYWEDGTGGFVSGVLPPVDQNDMTTIPDTDFVRVEGNWDTLRLNNFIERFYRGVFLKANAESTILNVTINNSLYDYIRFKAIDVDAVGGTVSGVYIHNSSFNSWESHCIHFSSTGSCRNIEITNQHVIFAGGSGIQFSGNVSNFKLLLPKIKGCKRKIAGNGIVIAKDLRDFSIEGGEIGGDVSTGGITWGENSGLSLLGNNNNYSIRGVMSFRFEISTPTTSEQTNASKKRQCKDNIWIGNEAGYNYAGYKSASIYTLPASGTLWYNTTPYDVEIHIWGGTIQELTKEGNILNANGTSFTLRPGERFGMFYTTAPNISFFVRQ